MIVYYGPPGVGRSTLADQICRNSAAKGHRILYGYSSERRNRPHVVPEDQGETISFMDAIATWERYYFDVAVLDASPLYGIYDGPSERAATLNRICLMAERRTVLLFLQASRSGDGIPTHIRHAAETIILLSAGEGGEILGTYEKTRGEDLRGATVQMGAIKGPPPAPLQLSRWRLLFGSNE